MSRVSVEYVDGMRADDVETSHTIGPVPLNCPSAGPPLNNDWACLLIYQKAELVGDTLCATIEIENGRLIRLSDPDYALPSKALYYGVVDTVEHVNEIEGAVQGDGIGKPMLVKNLFSRNCKDDAKVDDPNPCDAMQRADCVGPFSVLPMC